MARKKKNESVVVDDVSEKSVKELFEMITELNPDAVTLADNSLSTVNDFIDTGNYSLNAIMSGSVYGGAPVGRITGFFGLPSTGKTMIVNKICANAQKKGYKILYFDSEQALDKLVASRLGVDVDNVKHVPIETIEECRNQIFQILTKAMELGVNKKLMFVIDSIGALNTMKEINDSLADKNASDMGLKAKLLKSMLLKFTYRAAKTDTPILFTNHIYTNVGEMYPSMVKKQAGGLTPLFIASLLVQLSTTNIKAGDDKGEVGKMSDKISGANLKAFTTKNRFIPPYLRTEMYLNFKTGLDRYSGLLELAVAMGLIIQTGSTYVMDGEKLGYASKFAKNPEFWKGGPLDALEEILKKELTYSDELHKEIEEEVSTLEKSIDEEED